MAMDYPVFKLDARAYNALAPVTKVINKNCAEHHIWIHLEPYVSRNFDLYQIDELLPSGTAELDMSAVDQQDSRPWLQINFHKLNQEVGQHIYRLRFVNSNSMDVIWQYFAYIIQDDNPDKPYIYM